MKTKGLKRTNRRICHSLWAHRVLRVRETSTTTCISSRSTPSQRPLPEAGPSSVARKSSSRRDPPSQPRRQPRNKQTNQQPAGQTALASLLIHCAGGPGGAAACPGAPSPSLLWSAGLAHSFGVIRFLLGKDTASQQGRAGAEGGNIGSILPKASGCHYRPLKGISSLRVNPSAPSFGFPHTFHGSWLPSSGGEA